MPIDLQKLLSDVIERNQALLGKPISRRSFFEGLSSDKRHYLGSIIAQLRVVPSPQIKVRLEQELRNHLGQPCQIVSVLQTPELYEDVFVTTSKDDYFYWISRINYNY